MQSGRAKPRSRGRMSMVPRVIVLVLALFVAPTVSVVRPKLAVARPGPNLERPAREAPPAVAPADRDVVVKLCARIRRRKITSHTHASSSLVLPSDPELHAQSIHAHR